MEFNEIIHSLARSETVPAEAVRAALADPSTFVDRTIPLLGRVAAGTSSEVEEDSLAILVHVLGEIGDERVFEPLMRVLALPPEDIGRLLDDVITMSLGNILISLAGDRASVLEESLADIDIDDFVRDAIFDAWTRLVLTGHVSREKARAFLSGYPIRVGLDSSDFGWSSWLDAVTILGFEEMRGFANEHLARESDSTSILDAPNVTFEDFEHELANTLADPERWKSGEKYQPFTGTIDELSGWYCYSEDYRQRRAEIDAMDAEEEFAFGTPYIADNPFRDIGRNDPCPCGSGKKFKKCCLTKSQA